MHNPLDQPNSACCEPQRKKKKNRSAGLMLVTKKYHMYRKHRHLNEARHFGVLDQQSVREDQCEGLMESAPYAKSSEPFI